MPTRPALEHVGGTDRQRGTIRASADRFGSGANGVEGERHLIRALPACFVLLWCRAPMLT